MSEFGTYLVEFNDGSKVIFGNNYKPWWQHATEYVYRFMGDRKGVANRGWRYEYVEDVVVSVSHSDTPFYDDGGLKWCPIGEYQDVINDVSRNSENPGVKRVKAENIVFAVSPSLKATLTKKLKRF